MTGRRFGTSEGVRSICVEASLVKTNVAGTNVVYSLIPTLTFLVIASPLQREKRKKMTTKNPRERKALFQYQQQLPSKQILNFGQDLAPLYSRLTNMTLCLTT